MHAVYDMLRYGPTSFASVSAELGLTDFQWDHRTFPGAVPRSFVPPILLALASWPTATVAAVTGMAASSIDTQQIGTFLSLAPLTTKSGSRSLERGRGVCSTSRAL